MLCQPKDSATPSGEFLVNVMAAAAQFERRIIGQRTREGMAQKRAEGVHVGRQSKLPADVVERLVHDRVVAVAADKLKLSTSDQRLARELR